MQEGRRNWLEVLSTFLYFAGMVVYWVLLISMVGFSFEGSGHDFWVIFGRWVFALGLLELFFCCVLLPCF